MLNAEERALALARIDADQIVSTHGQKEPTTLKLILRAFNFNVSVMAWCGSPLTFLSDDTLRTLLSYDQYIIPRAQSLYADCDCNS